MTSAREPTADVAVGESADPTEEKPLSYTVSGTTEVDRRLYVYAISGAGSCPALASGVPAFNEISGSGPFSGGETVAAGAFSRTFDYTPANSGPAHVCAYVTEGSADTSNASAAHATLVREPAAAVALSPSGGATVGQPVTVATTGTTELDRRLQVYAVPGAGSCPARASGVSSASEIAGSGAFSSGETVAAGAFARSLSFVPAQGGPYRLCAYVTETADDTPNATTAALVSVYDPTPSRSLVHVGAPVVVPHGLPVPIDVNGGATEEAFLFAYVHTGTAGCKATARQEARAAQQTLIAAQHLGVAYFTRRQSFGPAASGRYRACAYIAPGSASEPDATASTTFEILPDPALVPLLVTNDGDESHDRMVLVWRRGPDDDQDEIAVYSGDPDRGATPRWRYDVADPDELRLRRTDGTYRAVLPYLGYGRFWWTVTRTGADGSLASSAARGVRVIPRPLVRRTARATARLRLGGTSRHPGSASLLVVSAPRAAVHVVLRNGGRVLKRIGYREHYPGRRTLSFALSCQRTGRTTFQVTMRDPYGHRLVRDGAWTTDAARCARLMASEQQRAAERERRRRESSGGGGGGGGGSPYAGLNCSQIGHSFNVTPGSDPEHDADNDGVACESYG